MLADAHDAGRLTFFDAHAGHADKSAFKRFIAPLAHQVGRLRKAPFAGPKGAALSVPVHPPGRDLEPPARRSRRRGVAFRWKDYRIEGRDRSRP